MKKILFLVAFFSIASMASMNAQTKAAPLTAAIQAAKTNPDIIQKVGSDGSITFKEKSVCSKSGKVSYKPVSFDAKSKSWVAAPVSAQGAKSCGSKKGGKACCAGKKSCGSKKGKSCSGKAAKSCNKGKASCGSSKAAAEKKCGEGKCGK